MAANDARPFPIKNTAYRVYFPILDADGDLVSGATGLDSEESLDGGTFTDCTNEATEIATSSGVYYLDLTASEMNADCTVVIVKTTSSGAKTTVITLYPVETGDIDVDVTAFGGTAGTFASGRPEVNVSHIAGSAVSTTSAQIGVNVVNAGGTAWGSGAITAGAIASDAITAAKIADGAIDAATFAAGAITAGVIAADAIGASELAADAVAEIADAVWDEVLAGHLTAGSTGNALNAAGSAGDPWSTTLPGSYTGSQAGKMLSDILTDTAEIGAAGAGLTALASAANLATVDTVVDAILVDTAEIGTAGAGLTALASAANLAVVDNIVDQILDDTGTSGVIVASLAAGSITSGVIATGAIDADALAGDAATEIATAVLTTQMTESYRATNAAPTLAQAQFELIAHMGECAISSTTKTLKKLDGSTTAKTYTLNSATTPTSITETT